MNSFFNLSYSSFVISPFASLPFNMLKAFSFCSVSTDGNFVINIPRSLLDMKIEHQDDDFIVILDQLEVEYLEINTESDSRTLDIPLRQGEKTLEIIASSVGVLPEQSCHMRNF